MIDVNRIKETQLSQGQSEEKLELRKRILSQE
jgi:hypothetical protein